MFYGEKNRISGDASFQHAESQAKQIKGYVVKWPDHEQFKGTGPVFSVMAPDSPLPVYRGKTYEETMRVMADFRGLEV